MSYPKSEDRSQVEYALEIEGLLAALTSQLVKAGPDGDLATARVKAVRMLSESVGMIVLSRALAAANPSLSDEILRASGRT
ncbi:hypothetical protein [Pendulispora albinea]|uniref:Uncharacterized protein n=1 Tax=Pendulispora albinea TaxID=2741071 RepID=A0ABZ2LVR5_9BACT